eukprot:m.481788 g.481788  ORF g.481788 m.481788 type:complete len:706 (-) comp22328_c0_seq1:117-2234(-)
MALRIAAQLARATRGGVTPFASAALRPLSTTAAQGDDVKLFDKLLVANRGEIACRVMKTCKRLGIKTVAVHSEADANALHVRTADESFCIGPAPSVDSYLRIDRIMEAIAESGAQAVHPGYGFLSENREFASELEKANVAFLGPGSHAIEVMGDKIESKLTAEKANVNIIPGFNGVVTDQDHCVKLANEIGYPVMIKATAGGGGMGMRIAHNDSEARDGFRFSTEVAKNSFGDDRLLIEKFVEDPRHIEFQLLADGHGNAVYLNERECSIQRRNQKVIEEAPSVCLDPELRRAMGEQAIALAHAVDYRSAGTIEFLVDKHKNFYFLEMNTRLQVEHPITECITGVDIVEQMIRVAAGLPLNITQDDVGINGWAVEARVYAEDPTVFLPSTGRLSTYREPLHVPGVRCDSGIVEGSEVSMFYDPMICKLVTHAATRDEALDNMAVALDSYVIKGVTHNIPLIRDIIGQKRFREGTIDTNYIPDTYPDGFKGYNMSDEDTRKLAAVSAFLHLSRELQNQLFINQPGTAPVMYTPDLVVTIGGEQHALNVEVHDDDVIQVLLEGSEEPLLLTGTYQLGAPLFECNVNSEEVIVQPVSRDGATMQIRYCGTVFDVAVRSTLDQKFYDTLPPKAEVDTSALVITPMPGTLISVAVEEGQEVLAGQEVAVVEAMKMQNQLMAPRSGKVLKIHHAPGSTLALEDIILEFEQE